jgi:hypothetical protein
MVEDEIRRNNNPPTNTAVLEASGYEFKTNQRPKTVYIDAGRGWRRREDEDNAADRATQAMVEDISPGVGGDQVAPSADVDELATTPSPNEG